MHDNVSEQIPARKFDFFFSLHNKTGKKAYFTSRHLNQTAMFAIKLSRKLHLGNNRVSGNISYEIDGTESLEEFRAYLR